MKKIIKKIIGLLFASMLIISVGGCGAKDLTVDEIVKKSNEVQKNINSGSFSMNLIFSFVDNEESINMNILADGDILMDPLAYKMNLSFDLGEYGGMDTEMYIVKNEDHFDVYTGTQFLNQMLWMHQTQALDDLSYNFSSTAQDSLGYDIGSYSLIGEELVDEENTYHIQVTISGDKLEELMDSLNFNEEIGIDEEIFDEVVEAYDKCNYDIWINTSTFYVSKISLDMTEIINSLTMTPAFEGEAHAEKLSFEMSFSNHNQIDKIEIPQEALDTPAYNIEDLV